MQTTLRDQTVKVLLEMRDSAALDLATMPAAKEASQWARDRYDDIAYANRNLAMLGALPAAR